MKRSLILAGIVGALLSTAALGATTKSHLLPFIHDDYARALAQAKAKNAPLFVEAWAPW
ncbi:MAG: hypothetical protein WBX15_18185 [Thermoanaerobaculia bacterium]